MGELKIPPKTTLNESPAESSLKTAEVQNDPNIRLDRSAFVKEIWRFKCNQAKSGETINIQFQGLYIDGILQRLIDLGFYKRRPTGRLGLEYSETPFFIRVQECIIEPVEIGYMVDCFREAHIKDLRDLHVEDNGVNETFPAEALREIFIKQFNNVFNEKTLRLLPLFELPILEDTREAAFFFFSNGLVKVTKDDIILKPYDKVKDKVIWRERMINLPFHECNSNGGHWEQFILNVSQGINDPARLRAFRSAIGYLLHNYNNSAMGQAVICYDEKPARKGSPQGGSGKGVFAQGIRHLRNSALIDGKSFKDDDKFKWQQVTQRTQVVSIDDPHPKFRLDILFSALTEGWNIEYKNRDKIHIPPEDSPKTLITTNTALSSEGTSNKRRQFVIEFSDYYSRKIIKGNEEPIKDEHSRIFFSKNEADGWTAKDFNEYIAFQLDCVRDYLKNGLVVYEPINLILNQLLQTTDEDFVEWIEAADLQIGKEYDKKELFKDFTETYHGDNSPMNQRTFTDWLKRWARLNGYDDKHRKSNGKSFLNIVQKTQ